MSLHRFDTNINELKTYFNSVIDWVSTVFTDVESEMRGLEWGRLYETYRKQPYNPQKVSEQVRELYADSYVKNRKGVFEFILGGRQIINYLTFGFLTKQPKISLRKTNNRSRENGTSNCPYVQLVTT